MNKGRPMKRTVKIRVSTGGRVVKHVFIGTLFALINETSSRFFPQKKKEEEKLMLIPLETTKDHMKEDHYLLFKKEEVFKKIDGNFHLTHHYNKERSEFLKHFIYGSLILFLSSGLNQYLKGFSMIKPLATPYHILMAASLSIVPYYAFCSFYDRKTLNEFWKKLAEDFLPLGFMKCCIDITHASLITKAKSITVKNVNHRIKTANLMLIFCNVLWFFMLVSLYHDRISLKRESKEEEKKKAA